MKHDHVSRTSGVVLLSLMLKKFYSLPRHVKQRLLQAFDVSAAVLAVWFSMQVSDAAVDGLTYHYWALLILAPMLMFPLFSIAGIYRSVARYTGFPALLTVARVTFLYGIAFFMLVRALRLPGVSPAVGVMQPMMFMLVIGGGRAMVRFWFSGQPMNRRTGGSSSGIIIYGAGKAGTEIARFFQLSGRYRVVGFLDDDQELHGRTINGIPIHNPDFVGSMIAAHHVKTVLIAMPSVSRRRRNELVDFFRKYPVTIKTLPGIEQIACGEVSITDIKEVEIGDLLGRDSVPVDLEILQRNILGKVIMVTGAGGSIGSELCRQILSAKPECLLLVDSSEYNLYTIHADLERCLSKSGSNSRIMPLLCDVSDKSRVNEICMEFRPSVIYHAAAYKHVPMIEQNPAVGVRNNVFGTLALVEAAVHWHVSNFVLVSTDKAVRPTNVMGASKRICEMIVQAYAAESGTGTILCIVRFGNVLGSSGSVVPLFHKQIRNGGPVTITHLEMTRYFMTISEAAQLVIQAGGMATGGKVYLLDMGQPVKIIDLAKRMIELSGLTIRDAEHPEGDIPIEVTGLRHGEKLYEELLIGENPIETANKRIFMGKEHFIGLDDLRKGLDLMADAIKNNDVRQLLSLLKNFVVEYRASDMVKGRNQIQPMPEVSLNQEIPGQAIEQRVAEMLSATAGPLL